MIDTRMRSMCLRNVSPIPMVPYHIERGSWSALSASVVLFVAWYFGCIRARTHIPGRGLLARFLVRPGKFWGVSENTLNKEGLEKIKAIRT